MPKSTEPTSAEELNSRSNTSPRASWLGLIAIGVFAALVLSGVRSITAEKVAHNRQQQAQRALMQLLGKTTLPPRLVWVDDELAVCAQRTVWRTTAAGYGGPITLLLAWAPRPDATASLYNVVVAKHQETPGIGDFFEEQPNWFTPLYQINAGGPSNGLEVASQTPDAVSGATITARALINAIAQAQQATTENGSPTVTFNPTPCTANE